MSNTQQLNTSNSQVDILTVTLPRAIWESTPDYYLIPLPYSTSEPAIPLALLVSELPPNLAEAVRHIFRSGKKPGETAVEALQSAINSLALEISILNYYSGE